MHNILTNVGNSIIFLWSKNENFENYFENKDEEIASCFIQVTCHVTIKKKMYFFKNITLFIYVIFFSIMF